MKRKKVCKQWLILRVQTFHSTDVSLIMPGLHLLAAGAKLKILLGERAAAARVGLSSFTGTVLGVSLG